MSKDLSHKKKHLFVQDPDLASDYNSGVNGKTAGTGTAAGSTTHTSHHSSKILGKLTNTGTEIYEASRIPEPELIQRGSAPHQWIRKGPG